MAIELNLDLGFEDVKISHTGETVRLMLNDNNLPVRFEQAQKNIYAHAEELQKKYNVDVDIENINAVSTGDITKDVEIIKEADEYIKSQIDFIFNSNGLADKILGGVSALTVNRKTGEYLYETVLNGFIPIVNNLFDASLTAIRKRVKTYIDKKNIHPALK